MATGPVCWGIELGAGAVKAVKIARDGESLKVLEYAVIPHKRVLSAPDLDQTDARRVALGSLIANYDLSGAPIAVSVPGHSAFARFAKLPPVEPKKIPDIVKFEAQQQIPFPMEEVEWDFQTFTNSQSPDVEVGIFAITRERVMETLSLWEDVGITPETLTLGPVALFNSMAWDLQFSEDTPGTVILDVGTTSTDLIISEKGRVWVRTFQLGGHNFTEALVNAFKLSYLKAEKLKREAEQSKHARHVFQAMRPVFGDLAQEVQRSIGYYQSLHADANLTRLIVFGSTFNLPGLRKYLGQQLQMEIIRLDRFKRLDLDGAAASEFQGQTLCLGTAYGLALQGLGLPTIDANLMPKLVIRESMWARKRKWFAVAAALALAAQASFVGPLLDEGKLAAKPKSNTIEQVKRSISQARRDWGTVESEFTPNFNAANALRLLDHRDICPHLVNDVGQVIAHAAEASRDDRSDKPLLFEEFDMNYVGLGRGDDDPGAVVDPWADDYDDEPDADFAAGDEDAGPAGRRMNLTLRVSTVHEDPARFVRDTVQAWLFENSERDGVPYVIPTGSVKWVQTGKRVVAAEGEDEVGGAGEIQVTRNDRRADRGVPPARQRPREEAPRDLGPRTNRQLAPPNRDSRTAQRPARAPVRRPARTQNDPFNNDYNGDTATDVNQVVTKLDEMAPLPADPPIGQPGETVYTFEITWEAVIVDPSAEEMLVSAVLAWSKKNILIIVFLLLTVAALVVGPMFGGKMGKKLQDRVQQEVTADYNSLTKDKVTYAVWRLDDPGLQAINESLPVHADRTDYFKILLTELNEEGGRIWELALERNRAGHDILVEGLFPEPSRDDELLLPGEFARQYSTEVHAALLKAINAGAPPDADETFAKLSNYEINETQRMLEARAAEELTEEEAEGLLKELQGNRIGIYRQAAADLDVYAVPSLFIEVPAEPEERPELGWCWDWQMQIWVHEDILAAIARANSQRGTGGRGVPGSVVKRILSISVPQFDEGFVPETDPGDTFGGGGPLIPDPTDIAQTEFDASITGRVSGPFTGNKYYDLRNVTLDVIVSSERLPLLFDAISQTNFMTVLDCDITSIPALRDLSFGYYYGEEHVVRATIEIETIWLREWTKHHMPPDLRRALGIPDEIDQDG